MNARIASNILASRLRSLEARRIVSRRPEYSRVWASSKCELLGSDEAYVDSRLPGHKRRKINLIGMGVVERAADPDLAPNIPSPAHGFNPLCRSRPSSGHLARVFPAPTPDNVSLYSNM